MSRRLTWLTDGTCKEEIENKDLCRWLVNRVCCNDLSEWFGKRPEDHDCKQCGCFVEEKTNDYGCQT